MKKQSKKSLHELKKIEIPKSQQVKLKGGSDSGGVEDTVEG